jgi:hypothetical protein
VNTAGFAVDQSPYLHHIGLPGSVGTSVRVRDLDAEGNVFSAEITFSHFLHLLYEFHIALPILPDRAEKIKPFHGFFQKFFGRMAVKMKKA